MERSPPLPKAPSTIDTARASLFLDFDGTLVELIDRPESVEVSADLGAILERLSSKLDGRIAVVSGRSIAQLRGFFGSLSDNLAMVGSHGAEIGLPGSALVSPEAPRALREAEQCFANAFSGNEGIVIEGKSLGVAIHYRLAPSEQATAERLAQEFASQHGLTLQRGKMMVEVRTAGQDKGTGISSLMCKRLFEGSVPVFLGDDITDEPGFRRCAALGGFGVLVGAPRPTAAQYWLPDVPAVHQWLIAL